MPTPTPAASPDPRRNIPRMDELLQLPEVESARQRLAEHTIRAILQGAVARARRGQLPVSEIPAEIAQRLEQKNAHSLRPVINATGVIIHTNLGRAPLPSAAVEALQAAASYTDVEMDLDSGKRSRNRGAGATAALLAACPGAEDALVVNNGASALLLATAALAPGKEVIISRGELIEIGAGFRLPELIESTATRLKEIGATNRTHLADYERALSDNTGAILKVHPSNFRIEGFTSAVGVEELHRLAVEHDTRLIVDLGSGLLTHDPALPEEPDIQAQLRAGADIVIASGDKLLGGPQAGILLGTKEAIAAVKKHPLARAVRIDKLRLNALEAAISTPSNAVQDALHLDPQTHRERTESIAQAVGAEVVPHDGRVGGGGAPEYPLPGFAVSLPERYADALRRQDPPVVGRMHQGRCLVDIRCVPADHDAAVIAAIKAVS
ncbi:L-seryl-tRNA(Sec) selenium transferase [Corynebacterium tuberculostearicum]|uniref:L-seryl-tRNA(Sec) selenium transferase n=1 Tax=Corynebacterium tuberculostearicum TaxID=38304 RepID=A0AAE4SWJ9_9CORY|nr:L-seryl-tRNA(Sec) selenium transferase [Corynebacterium tuberculostearicum]MDV2418446.1 L-seryl-tRNA(Sec) selenium transferase [Corynebacterium tuberculostearicum]